MLEIPGTGYRDNLFDNQPVNEIGLQEKWYYFGQDGALLDQTDKQVLFVKTSENFGKVYSEQYRLSAEKIIYYFDVTNADRRQAGFMNDPAIGII